MGDATASVPDGPDGVSTVEYAMVYQAEKPRLVRYLIQCGANWHEADDAAQHALAALHNQWGTVRNPRPWLRTVAFREFIGTRDANERSRKGLDQLRVPEGPADIESLLEQDAVLSAIRRLPDRQRRVFALHFDQFETSEIAEVLQISEAAVRQNLARARARLKELLGLTPCGLTTVREDPARGSEGGI
jgi:RNA polymerase sigma-70 factor (ECF subfamily)